MRVVSNILQPIKSFTESFVDDFAVISSDWEEHKLLYGHGKSRV